MFAIVSQPEYAAGVVSRCDNPSFSAALCGEGTVTFACTGTIYALNNPITISADTTIVGNYRVTIDGGGVAQLFEIKPGIELTLENLSFAHAFPVATNLGDLLVKNCRFLNGGALAFHAVLEVRQSAFFGNIDTSIINNASATMTNSTFWGNSSVTFGCNRNIGHDDDHQFDFGRQQASNRGGGGNIYVATGTLVLQNTIVANGKDGNWPVLPLVSSTVVET